MLVNKKMFQNNLIIKIKYNDYLKFKIEKQGLITRMVPTLEEIC